MEYLSEMVTTVLERDVVDPAEFARHFDRLSPNIQRVALREFVRHAPHRSILEIADVVHDKLTLAEQYEAEQWGRSVPRGMFR